MIFRRGFYATHQTGPIVARASRLPMSQVGQSLRTNSALAQPVVRCWSDSERRLCDAANNAKCQSRLSLRRRKTVGYFTISYGLPDGTQLPVEEPSKASKGDTASARSDQNKKAANTGGP
jgi:hypothetical protein